MHVYVSSGRASQIVGYAFAQGANVPVVPAVRLEDGPVVMYGMLRGLGSILEQAKNKDRDYFYIDRGYFGAVYGKVKGTFRVTRNNLQFQGPWNKAMTEDRFSKFGLDIKPWRRGGKSKHILLVEQTDQWYSLMGHSSKESFWNRIEHLLRRHTDREFRYRKKPPTGLPQVREERIVSLEDDLKNCWAVVTYSSNVAIEAILQGVPAFVIGTSGASPMAICGEDNLDMIESPFMPKEDGVREAWANVLAHNQWTLNEMIDGTCWSEIKEMYK